MYKYYVSYRYKFKEFYLFLILDYKLDTEENIIKMINYISKIKGVEINLITPTFWKNLKK